VEGRHLLIQIGWRNLEAPFAANYHGLALVARFVIHHLLHPRSRLVVFQVAALLPVGHEGDVAHVKSVGHPILHLKHPVLARRVFMEALLEILKVNGLIRNH
jgi:hypothetical protein